MLSEQTVATIEQLQSRYPIKRGALLMALHAAQEEKGFLTKSDFAEIGDLFNLDPAEVESVSSFYTMFYTKPQGKCLFQMCTNVSCMVDGAYAVLEHLRTTLGIAPGQVTEDGLFGLMEVECLAACDTAPCLQVSDREFFPRVTIEQVDKIIAHYRSGGSHPAPGAEANPLAWSGSVDFEPLAPLTPSEIKPRPGSEPPKPAAPSAPASGGAPSAAPAPKATPKSAPTTAVKAADAPLTATELKAEAEAYARIDAAIKAREEEKQAAIRAEEDRLAKRAAQQAAWRAEAEEADARKLAEVELIERAKYREATKLIIVRPPEPDPEPEPEEESTEADLSKLHEGMHIGGAAPALSAASSWDAPAVSSESQRVAQEPEPEPIMTPKEPLERQHNLETSADLPTWEPSNPYLRYLAQPDESDDTPKEGNGA